MRSNKYSYQEKKRNNKHALKKISDKNNLGGQLLIAMGVLVAATILVSVALLLTEGRGTESAFSSYWACLFWTVMAYLGNPAGIGDWPIATSGGRIVAIVVQIITIAFYAAFTGLLVALITAWYKGIVRRAKLEKTYRDLIRAFRRQYAWSLSLNRGYSCHVVPSQKLFATLQVNLGVDLNDIVEVASRYYGFRIKNLANVRSMEDQGVTDRFIVEHFPVNREYGCCLDRGSNITIISPTSDRSVGIGWFSYYLALFGGFNYISKDYDADPLSRTSFYNLEKDVSEEARLQRDDFVKDVKKLCMGRTPWLIFLLSFTQSKSMPGDIHLSCAKKDNLDPTVKDMQVFQDIVQDLEAQVKSRKICGPSSLFPLRNNNLIYTQQSLYDMANAFTVRISSSILKADTERLLIAEKIAGVLCQHIEPASLNGLSAKAKEDLEDKTTATYALTDWI